MKKLSLFVLVPLLASVAGCEPEGTSVTPDMNSDFSHDHSHQHNGEDDHEHSHDDGFTGSHSHGHSHSHRHGEPLHGGRIVSIGHTHHKGGATHFHAEVMPLVDDVIRFHLLTESDDGESIDYSIAAKEIPGLMSIKGKEAGSKEVVFEAVGEGEKASEFALTIPQSLSDGEKFSVVIPKLTLGGHKQNFSFTASREKSEAEDSSKAKTSEVSTESEKTESEPEESEAETPDE